MGPAAGEAGLAVIELARQGDFAGIRQRFAPPLQEMVPDGALRAAWESETGAAEAITAVGAPVTEDAGPAGVLVKVLVTFERGALTVAIGLAGDEPWITGIQLLPASAAAPMEPWQPPAYARPGTFTETDVAVGDGPLAVPGVLTLPRGSGGPVPGVVLLSGSGPHDADETIGRNKPLKDIAWGLASAGIAVARFEKVTRAHPAQCAASPGFTVTDEYVPHAVAAIRLLGEQPGVDAARICVAGHSLGGTVAPRVAAAEPSVAGLVLLAGGAQPMHRAAVRQFRHLVSLGAASAAALEVITGQAQAVDSAGLSADTPAAELPFGVPASYWLDVRGYDPAAAAAALGKPVLLIQGGRDYQVTVADDLSLWQAALAGRADVTVRVHDADNHLFFPGSGPSSPAEYEPAQHVDPAVVADIAGWLTPAR